MGKFSIKKIEPHFYYNALEYINSIANINNIPDISKVVLALGNMMRYWTDNDNEWVTIYNELEYINQYLTITRLRYDCAFEFYINSENIEGESCPIYVLEPILNDIILNVIGSDISGIEIIITVKKVEFEILINSVKLKELRYTSKIMNNFIYGENRLKKLTDRDVYIKYENNNTIITYMV